MKDRAGQKLAYVYCEEEPGRRSSAKLLTKDEARGIAANAAKLLDLVDVMSQALRQRFPATRLDPLETVHDL